MQPTFEIVDSTLGMTLTTPMSVRGFEAETFSTALGENPTLLVFLRHFG